MNRSFITAIAFAALLCGGARADDIAKPSLDQPAKTPCMVDGKPADPDALAAALDLQAATGSAQHIEQVIDLVMPSMIEMVRKNDNSVSQETITAFVNELRIEMKSSIPQVLTQTACVLVRHYSLSEMQQIKAFYASDLGKKLLAESPAIGKEMFSIGEAWGASAGMAAAQRVVEKLRAKGMKI